MPYLHLRLSTQPSHDDAARIASVLTDLTAEILGKKRELTAVSIETIAPQRWTISGVPLARQSLQSFFLDVKVSAGTNSQDEMAEYIARAHAALELLLGPLAPASYVAIDEHAADAWGYQGRTQESRAGAATPLPSAVLDHRPARAPGLTRAATPPADAHRLDLYSGIHKALRLVMSDTLTRVGRLDTDDAGELADTLGRVDALLDALRAHLVKENTYVHPAIEARRPGAGQRVAVEHADHLEGIAALEAETAALRALPSAPAALRLYRQLALFLAENLEHMHVEETEHNALLWDAYGDAELAEIEQRILASIEPAEMATLLPLMASAASPAELATMLGGLQQQMPPEAMRGVLESIRPRLNDTAWAKLARALNLPAPAQPQPLVVAPADRPQPLPVIGLRITVLASSAVTRAHEVTLQQGDEGMGPPPHCHPWPESFYVTEGEVVFECAGRSVRARPGTLVHVPAGTMHAFRFGRGGGAMLEIAGAGGQATAMFGALATQFPPGPPAESDLPRLIDVLRQHEVSVAA